MAFRRIVSTNMGITMLTTLILSAIIPISVIKLTKSKKNENRIWCILILILYMIVILYLTIFDRNPNKVRTMNLVPFWSYSNIALPQYRWQIYMNIFLFIPFGFMFTYATGHKLLITLIAGIVFSIIIEIIQYIWALGLCEFDDVFHNSLGTLLGYVYRTILKKRYRI